MKISKERLKQLIAEEMTIGVGSIEASPPVAGGCDDAKSAKQNLWKMAEYASELQELIDDNDKLEAWIQEKIAVASFMLDSVAHYIQYEKRSKHEEIEGHEDSEEYELDLEMPGEDDEEDQEDMFYGKNRVDNFDRDEEYEDEEEYSDDEEESPEEDEEFSDDEDEQF